MRSHYCGEITTKNLDKEVTLCGWVHKEGIMEESFS